MRESPNPYIGPRPFDEQYRYFYFGRHRESDELSQLSAIEQVVVLYGSQGSGKTSLVMAGLIPRLEAEGHEVMPVGRVAGRTLERTDETGNIFLYNLLLSLDQDRQDPALLADMSLTEWHQAQKDSSRNDGSDGIPSGETDGAHKLRLLIIDRFEEIFTVYPERWSEREGFFHELGAALRADPLLSVILCLREEHLAQLDPYAGLVPGRLRVRYRIERMGREAALAAVRGPAMSSGRPFAPGAAEALVDSLQQIRISQADGTWAAVLGQYIDPFQLQIVCQRLWSNLPSAESVIGAEDIAAVGDVDAAIVDFYEAAISRSLATAPESAVSERQLRLWCEQELISETQTRSLLLLGPETAARLPNPLVYSLVESYLLRLETRAGERWVELQSDRFIQPILASNQDWFVTHRDELFEAALAWDRAGRSEDLLLRGRALSEAISGVDAPDDSPFVQDFLEAGALADAQRRARVLRSRVITIGVVVLAFVFLMQWIIAINARNIAMDKANSAATAGAIAVVAEAAARSDQQFALDKATTAVAAEAMAQIERDNAFWDMEQAEIASKIAAASNLAAQALFVQDQKPELGLLLAVEAVGAVPSGQDIPAAVRNALDQLLISIGGVPLIGHADSVTALAFSPNGAWLVSGSANGTAIVWDPIIREQVLQLRGHEAEILDVAVSPDGTRLATASWDNTARLWDVESGVELARFAGHTDSVTSVTFSPDGRFLITGGQDGLALVWDAYTGKEIYQLSGLEGPLTEVLVSPDGKSVVTASEDGSVRLWDLSSASSLETSLIFTGHTERVTDIAISPTGNQMATASLDGTVRVWSLVNPAFDPVVLNQSAPVYAVAYTPDAQYLVVSGGSQSTAATLWDTDRIWVQSGLEVGRQASPVVGVALSPDARWLATLEGGNSDIKLWDLTQPDASAIALRGHESPVTEFTFSPDASMLVSSDSDGSIRLWTMDTITDRAPASDLQLPDDLELACRTAGRNLTDEEWEEYFSGENYRQTCPMWSGDPPPNN